MTYIHLEFSTWQGISNKHTDPGLQIHKDSARDVALVVRLVKERALPVPAVDRGVLEDAVLTDPVFRTEALPKRRPHFQEKTPVSALLVCFTSGREHTHLDFHIGPVEGSQILWAWGCRYGEMKDKCRRCR